MNKLYQLKATLDEIYAPVGGVERFTYTSGVDSSVPIAEIEILLIRHGWPSKDQHLRPEEWTLDYTAYLDLACYLDHSVLENVVQMYTSPQVMAKQTAGFFFAQRDMTELVTLNELNEVVGVNPEDREAVRAFFAGNDMEGTEGLAVAQKRIVSLVKELAVTARGKRQSRIALVGHGLLFAALRQYVIPTSVEEIIAGWEQIPYGPYAILRVNALDEITWMGMIERPAAEETKYEE